MAEPSICSHTTLFCAATVAILITIYALRSFTNPELISIVKPINEATTSFYDDPKVGYTIDTPMREWDEKRREWLEQNPSFAGGGGVLVVTGSQPSQCSNPSGDHLLLRFFKNKVDYCRIHGYQIFYNNAFMHPDMRSFWAKAPVLRAAMVAHPEVEWLFWVDADAVFTDMEFRIPYERYEGRNLVVYGWPERIYEARSWVSLNAGVFLLRNCQWSMDFLEVWAGMGPKSPNYNNWGKILNSALTDMNHLIADDQSAMVYMLLTGEKWRNRTYVENEYYLSGYWLYIVDKYEEAVEEGRRHAEAVGRRAEEGREGRPFVTHFTGCAPCSGEANEAFKGRATSCREGMETALNFADNQVLRNYGFVRPDTHIFCLLRHQYLPLFLPSNIVSFLRYIYII